jgi:signal transduction histidine kinase
MKRDRDNSLVPEILASAISDIHLLGTRAQELHDIVQLKLFQSHVQLKQMNHKIARERHRFLSLFNMAPIGYLVLDKNNHILNANIASSLLFVTPGRDLVGKNFAAYIDEKCWEQFLHVRKQLRIDKKRSCEADMRSPLGKQFPAKLDMALSYEGETLVAITDISSFKNAERDLTIAHNELRAAYISLQHETIQRQAAEDELRKFTRRLLEAQEKERQKIAHELHDNAGQLMTYLGLLLEKARLQLDPAIYRDAKSITQEVLDLIRIISSDLQPSLLRSVGLAPSLEALFDGFKEITNINIDYEFNQVEEDISGPVAVTVYRIIQEALTNAARYAEVNQVQIRIHVDDGLLKVMIKDKGVGFDIKSGKASTGLTGMTERAKAVGGRLTINSKPGQGTSIIAELPLSSITAQDGPEYLDKDRGVQ